MRGRILLRSTVVLKNHANLYESLCMPLTEDLDFGEHGLPLWVRVIGMTE